MLKRARVSGAPRTCQKRQGIGELQEAFRALKV
jgi:hypothetical protein